MLERHVSPDRLKLILSTLNKNVIIKNYIFDIKKQEFSVIVGSIKYFLKRDIKNFDLLDFANLLKIPKDKIKIKTIN